MKRQTVSETQCELWADYAIQDAITQARYGEQIMEYVRQASKAKRTESGGIDYRQLHRQHCQPESAPIDWSGLLIAAVIVFVFTAVVIGSTIDFWGL